MNTKGAIMTTIFASTSQGKNHYTVTSVDAILENLKKYHGIVIKRRDLFYHLERLESEKYIHREQRYRNDEAGLITQIPSMITFPLKGIVYFTKNCVKGAKEIYKSMVKWLNKEDKRYPEQKDFDDGSYKPGTPEERERLKGLLGIVGKEI